MAGREPVAPFQDPRNIPDLFDEQLDVHGARCEVLQLLAEGKSTKQIGDMLNLSVKTVETHRQHIMGKLHLRTVVELTRYAIREGLTPQE